MTPAARLQAAIELLEAVAETPRPADGTASAYFRDRRYIGSKDRRAISNRVWGMLRRWARTAWWLRRAWMGPAPSWEYMPPRARLVADLVLHDGMGEDAIEALFNDEDHAPQALGGLERHMIKRLKGQSLEDPEMPTWVRHEVPEWVIARLTPLYGDHLGDVLTALNAEGPVDLRVNTLKTDLERAVAELAAEEVVAMPTRFSPLGLRLEGRPNLAVTKAFRDGLVEVQDEGSQLVALLADARPGQAVVDFCAGAGGKTLAMSAAMQGKGRLVACDVSEGRLDRSAVRLKRAGAHNVSRRVLSGERDKWVKRSVGSYDRVLIDAPCSGTGTWRRNPDAKWRLSEESIADLIELQANILRSAARLAKPGGRVIYATCSLLPEENEHQVEAFVSQTDDFRILPIPIVWAEVFGDTVPCPTEGATLRLDPARHGTDGFFVAVLERVV